MILCCLGASQTGLGVKGNSLEEVKEQQDWHWWGGGKEAAAASLSFELATAVVVRTALWPLDGVLMLPLEIY